LFDKNCNLEDEIFATTSWPAGDIFSKRTAERKEDLSWQTSLNPGGTPGRENSSGFVEIEKKEKEPRISLSFPKEAFADQEFKVSLSVSDLENETYDIKISILKISEESEQKRTISEISLTGDEWQNSYKYLQKVFSGTSFSGDFKLRISQKYQDFKGEAEILARVRQSSNKKIVAEFKDKIEIQESEISKTETQPKIEKECIDINSASLEELQKIYGVGPVIAKRIIEARPFSSLDDLIKVKGIGEKTLQKIKEQGLACVK
jgi:competence ComEA-like helix-hairpin-helix protein